MPNLMHFEDEMASMLVNKSVKLIENKILDQ